jgi:hypothetical protein
MTLKWIFCPAFVVTMASPDFMVDAACRSEMGALIDTVEQARRLAMQTAQINARTYRLK